MNSATEIIDFEVPQLVVETDTRSYGIDITFKDQCRETYIYTYLREKYSEFSIYHNEINKMLREIFFKYNEKSWSTSDHVYSFDENHYRVLFLTNSIATSLSFIIKELLSLIYFSDNIGTTGKMQGDFFYGDTIHALLSNSKIRPELEQHLPLLHSVFQIDTSNSHFFMYPSSVFIHSDDGPFLFLKIAPSLSDSGIKRIPISELIAQYSLFFSDSKRIIRKYAPFTMTATLNTEYENSYTPNTNS